MNDTKWNFFDDEFYIVHRRWFDSWKAYVAYDYVLMKVVTERKRVQDLSVNQIMLKGIAFPGEVTNR